MGIPERKKREKERRRQMIIVAARRCFNKRGYKDTTVKQIANEANLSVGTIYHYFPSKEDLYTSVLLITFEYIYLRFVHIESQKIQKIEDRLNSMVEIMFKVISEESEFLSKLLNILSQESDLRLSFVTLKNLKSLLIKMNKISTKLFKVYHENIDKKYYDPIILSDIFWSTFIGLAVVKTDRTSLLNTAINIKPKLEMIFDILKRGVTHNEDKMRGLASNEM